MILIINFYFSNLQLEKTVYLIINKRSSSFNLGIAPSSCPDAESKQ